MKGFIKFYQKIPIVIYIASFAVVIGMVLILLNRAGIVITSPLHLAGISINLYGFFIVGGVLLAAKLADTELRQRLKSYKQVDLWLAVSIILVVAIIGARIFHVMSDWQRLYAGSPLHTLYIWDGGLSLFGGLAGGVIAMWFLARKYQLSLWPVMNIVVLFVPLAQIIGRFGNFFNQELFGGPTDLPWGIIIDTAHRVGLPVEQVHFHPAFWYEQLGNLLIICILWYLYKHALTKSKYGKLFHDSILLPIVMYLILYGLLRILMEQVRQEPAWLAGLSFGEAMSILAVGLGLGLGIYRYSKMRISRDTNAQ